MSYYLLFREAFFLADNKFTRSEEGLLRFAALSQASNDGIKNSILKHFPNVIPATRPSYNIPLVLDPWWVTVFTDGDGSFSAAHIRRLKTTGIPKYPTYTKIRFDYFLQSISYLKEGVKKKVKKIFQALNEEQLVLLAGFRKSFS